MSDYGDFVRFVVGHFAPKGVHTYMIWNEPNHPRLAVGPDANAYVPMLRAGYTAAKAASPDATVLRAGSRRATSPTSRRSTEAGGGDYFDAVAVQPYTYGVAPTDSWNGASTTGRIRTDPRATPSRPSRRSGVAGRLRRRGERRLADRVRLLDHDPGRGVSAATQAAFLVEAYRYIERFPGEDAFWYSARNSLLHGDRDEYEALRPRDDGLEPEAEPLGPARIRAAAPDHRPRGPAQGVQRSIAWGSARVTPAGASHSHRALPAGRRRRGAAQRTVLVQQRTPRGWVVVARVRTSLTGAFRVRVVARGSTVRYRAVARYEGLRVRSRVVRVLVPR